MFFSDLLHIVHDWYGNRRFPAHGPFTFVDLRLVHPLLQLRSVAPADVLLAFFVLDPSHVPTLGAFEERTVKDLKTLTECLDGPLPAVLGLLKAGHAHANLY